MKTFQFNDEEYGFLTRILASCATDMECRTDRVKAFNLYDRLHGPEFNQNKACLRSTNGNVMYIEQWQWDELHRIFCKPDDAAFPCGPLPYKREGTMHPFKIEAIKQLRAWYGMGLKESKELMDNWKENFNL